MKTMKASRILVGVIIGIVAFVGGTWVLSKALASNRDTLYHGQTLEYWCAQATAADAAASNQAMKVITEEIIPQLTNQMFHDTNDSKIRVALISKLEPLPWIKNITYYDAPSRRSMAGFDLGAFGPAAAPAIPALCKAVQGSDSAVHESAITALGEIHSEPEVVIPLLTKYLDDDNLDDEAATALAGFGSLARPAVPKIIPLLHADDDDARDAAARALQKIDPTAYTNAMNKAAGK